MTALFEMGVVIHLEGAKDSLQEFVRDLQAAAPPAASIAGIETSDTTPAGFSAFAIRQSCTGDTPITTISPDLSVCEDCVRELFDARNRRYHYPYINCTNCGPRYSVILDLPYDRPSTTIRGWTLDEYCRNEYSDPADRRFHAQPVACEQCGPNYFLRAGDELVSDCEKSVRRAAELLRQGRIVAVKGIGGYHLACDARNAESVSALRERKYRKEKPFAVMAKDLALAKQLVTLSTEARTLLSSPARPIVLAPAQCILAEVAPGSSELGVMLPYTPLHHLLFAAHAPEVLVLTSANRSSEPIAYEDDALTQLCGIADAFLIGERPIARRVDDSVVRVGACGITPIRRSRGYAPASVTSLPPGPPILALGADLKNTITLVVNGEAFVSQHIGDLSNYDSYKAFDETIRDMTAMYRIRSGELILAHDAHPQYASTQWAQQREDLELRPFQHHRAHVASVIAERRAWDKRIAAASFDGTGYGDDGTIWGGEFFTGSVAGGLDRRAHLRAAVLPGADAAANSPVQAAAGFLADLDEVPDLASAPFYFPRRYFDSRALIRSGVRTFPTTSIGRLFDAAAALLGFTRDMTYEGQAGMWLEELARHGTAGDAYAFSFSQEELDFRPLLHSLIQDRLRGRASCDIARAFQLGVAHGLSEALLCLCEADHLDTVVLSGGVFQNEMLLADTKQILEAKSLRIWTNHLVPPNDGGISLGQAALAAFSVSPTALQAERAKEKAHA
jgi:hydrogenase maturation protein HypF